MTFNGYSPILATVAIRKKHMQPLYLEQDRAVLLDELAAETRIAKAVLLREAVDDLLVKHKRLKVPKRKP